MKCKTHPKYQAKLKPRCLCEACWFLWIWRNLPGRWPEGISFK